MTIYLVQHAEALPEDEDPERQLSDIGRQHARSVARVLSGMGLEIGQIGHSGKLRARQTAQILGEAFCPSEGVAEVPGLSPLDDPKPIADELNSGEESLMLVGHLPFMARLAAHLLTGDPDKPIIRFSNAAVVCIERCEDSWQAAWMLTPLIAQCGLAH